MLGRFRFAEDINTIKPPDGGVTDSFGMTISPGNCHRLHGIYYFTKIVLPKRKMILVPHDTLHVYVTMDYLGSASSRHTSPYWCYVTLSPLDFTYQQRLNLAPYQVDPPNQHKNLLQFCDRMEEALAIDVEYQLIGWIGDIVHGRNSEYLYKLREYFSIHKGGIV